MSPKHLGELCAKAVLWFTFDREAKWLVVLYVLIPLLPILLAMCFQDLRRWFPDLRQS